jgi:hypothetical protein
MLLLATRGKALAPRVQAPAAAQAKATKVCQTQILRALNKPPT